MMRPSPSTQSVRFCCFLGASLLATSGAWAACDGTALSVGSFPPTYPLLDPEEVVHQSESRRANFDHLVGDLYDQDANPNITKILFIDGENRQVPPWFNLSGTPDCSDEAAEPLLHDGGGVISDPTLDPPNFLVNGDETSELAVVTAMSSRASDMWALYQTYLAMESETFSGLPCWLGILDGSTLTCHTNAGGQADTASDVTARWGLAFFLAARNGTFPAGQQATYREAALALTDAHLAHEYRDLSPSCPRHPTTNEEICHFVFAGSSTALPSSDGQMYVGYYQDITRLLLAAYSASEEVLYLDRAEEVVDQFLIANSYSGAGPSFGCTRFKWNLAGANPDPVPIGCPLECAEDPGYVWDDSDAPRALWMSDALRALHLATGGADLPSAYQDLLDWTTDVVGATGLHDTTCSCLQYQAGDTAPCFCGPGHYEAGLGLGLQTYIASESYATKLDSALSHYSWAEKNWDWPPNCFWIYRGVRTTKALATGIGLDDAIFAPSALFADGFESGNTSAWAVP